MRTKLITYRIGKNMHFPRTKMGNEICEETNLLDTDFIEETQRTLGKHISIVSYHPLCSGHIVGAK